jgi:cytochrome P450
VRRLDDLLYGMIRQRRQSHEQRGDLLSLLLHARDEIDNSRMTDRQLRDEAMTLFLAGHETTALALSWTWYLLARHPEVEARLVAEVESVLGSRQATPDDYPRLRYTEKVIVESMRLYPPAYLVGRENLQPCQVGDYLAPRGTTLLMSQWVVQRDAPVYRQRVCHAGDGAGAGHAGAALSVHAGAGASGRGAADLHPPAAARHQGGADAAMTRRLTPLGSPTLP